MSPDEESDTVEPEANGDGGSTNSPIESTPDGSTRRTALALIATGLSFLLATLLEREVFYRGYGDDGYGEEGFGG